MTAAEIVRLGVLENKVDGIAQDIIEIKGCITALDTKMTDAFVNKADRDYVEKLREIVVEKASSADIKEVNALITRLTIAVAGFALTTLVGLVLMQVFGK